MRICKERYKNGDKEIEAQICCRNESEKISLMFILVFGWILFVRFCKWAEIC